MRRDPIGYFLPYLLHFLLIHFKSDHFSLFPNRQTEILVQLEFNSFSSSSAIDSANKRKCLKMRTHFKWSIATHLAKFCCCCSPFFVEKQSNFALLDLTDYIFNHFTSISRVKINMY